ncbi:molybdopterin-binding protein [Mucilaginibacter litoreus]|uniref:Molybdopterin-binding protein n=1 Tax=Mucilaginibacter litoreus TaxID=1048221 RepID=A0ABW3AXM1_9SPHI
MKRLILIFLITPLVMYAQEKARATLQFAINGEIEKATVITLDSLKQYKSVEIGDIKVTDHLGNFKHQDDKLKGVLLKDVLSHSKYKAASPKLLSRFYFICEASDGYKVVYSWNELYNTAVGNQVYIITEKNGIMAEKMPESLQMTSASDFKTGRRYLHNLTRIEVKQVN